MAGVQFLAKERGFSLLHNIQTGSGAHLAFYPMGTRGFFPGNKVSLSDAKFKNDGAVPLLPHNSLSKVADCGLNGWGLVSGRYRNLVLYCIISLTVKSVELPVQTGIWNLWHKKRFLMSPRSYVFYFSIV
jgi:hypothetical protein